MQGSYMSLILTIILKETCINIFENISKSCVMSLSMLAPEDVNVNNKIQARRLNEHHNNLSIAGNEAYKLILRIILKEICINIFENIIKSYAILHYKLKEKNFRCQNLILDY